MHAALATVLGVGVLAILAAVGWKRVQDDEYRTVLDRARRIEADTKSQRRPGR